MRRNVLSDRTRFLSQVAMISLLASLTAACSGGVSRFGDLTGSTNNQRSIIGGDQPMPAPIGSSGQVQSTQLPPPVQAPVSSSQPLLPGVAAQPVVTDSRAMAAAATPPPLATPTATRAGGWDAAGGTVVTLGPGETLSSLSRRYGVPVKELASANGISDPSQVGSGMRITIPTYAAGAAPAATRTAAAPVPAPAKPAADMAETTSLNGLHTVAPGQTLNSIARLYNVSPRDLAAANQLPASDMLQSGQKLRIPGRGTSQVAVIPEPARREEKPKAEDPNAKPIAANTPANPAAGDATQVASAPSAETTASVAPAPSAAAASAAAEMAAAAAKPQPTAYAPPDDKEQTASAEPASANGTSFRWPVRGRIIGSFGKSATGDRNDGINLAVPAGTSIKAAEAGTVIYAGSELEGYGELVLVRHADGWVSAYAHNSEILVKRGDTVRRGQIISRAGTSGSVSSPQLHFELRRGSKPVNPLDYLQG